MRQGAIITTPYIQHYLPDAVVSVFNEPGDNAWLEINTTLDIASAEAQTGINFCIDRDDCRRWST